MLQRNTLSALFGLGSDALKFIGFDFATNNGLSRELSAAEVQDVCNQHFGVGSSRFNPGGLKLLGEPRQNLCELHFGLFLGG
jgi:hypothetical protein